MDNPFNPPKSAVCQELPEPPEKSYRYANYAYAALAFLVLFSVVGVGNLGTSLGDLMVTTYIFFPCATSASMLWGPKFLQSTVIRLHLFAVVGLVAYGVYMISNGQPPPGVVIVFSAWNLIDLLWSIKLFKDGDNPHQQAVGQPN